MGPRREKAKVKFATFYRNHGSMGDYSDRPVFSDSEPNELVRALRLDPNKGEPSAGRQGQLCFARHARTRTDGATSYPFQGRSVTRISG